MPAILEKELYYVTEENGPGQTCTFLKEPMNIHGVTVVWDSLAKLARNEGWSVSIFAGRGFIWMECWKKRDNSNRYFLVKDLTIQLPDWECDLPTFGFDWNY